jgi:hypothetical protein
MLLAALANYAKMLGQNHFAKPNQHVLISFIYLILIASSHTMAKLAMIDQPSNSNDTYIT